MNRTLCRNSPPHPPFPLFTTPLLFRAHFSYLHTRLKEGSWAQWKKTGARREQNVAASAEIKSRGSHSRSRIAKSIEVLSLSYSLALSSPLSSSYLPWQAPFLRRTSVDAVSLSAGQLQRPSALHPRPLNQRRAVYVCMCVWA